MHEVKVSELELPLFHPRELCHATLLALPQSFCFVDMVSELESAIASRRPSLKL